MHSFDLTGIVLPLILLVGAMVYAVVTLVGVFAAVMHKPWGRWLMWRAVLAVLFCAGGFLLCHVLWIGEYALQSRALMDQLSPLLGLALLGLLGWMTAGARRRALG
jgi:hypothetical protein